MADNTLFSTLRMPPSNPEAEQALLGALLCNNKAYERVGDFLQPQHFADPIHGKIYDAISRAVNLGRVADPVTLRADFENSGVLSEVGGIAYLAQLLGAMVGILNAGDYGRAIHDAWVRRELIEVCEVATNQAFGSESGVSGAGILEDLESALMRIADGAGDLRPSVQAGDAVHEALILAQAAGERVEALAGLTTGFKALDRMTGGLMPGQFYLLGARPAMGKSGLGLSLAARTAASGASVLFWSGEMGASQLGTRLAAAHSGIEVASVFRGKGWQFPHEESASARGALRKLDHDEWNRLVRAEREAYALPLHFDDRPGVTVAALRSRARRMKRSKAGLDLLVVDYIGLMRATPQTEKQKLYERLTEISRDLKMLAEELQIPLLAMAQLNRGTETRENKMPQLSDLRDSGALEQDAYSVLFLHRPHYYLEMAGEPVKTAKETPEAFNDRWGSWSQQMRLTKDLALISIAKNRNGPTGICRLKFQAETIWFRDESEADGSAAWDSNLPGEA